MVLGGGGMAGRQVAAQNRQVGRSTQTNRMVPAKPERFSSMSGAASGHGLSLGLEFTLSAFSISDFRTNPCSSASIRGSTVIFRMSTPSVVVVTNQTSPYQVEFMDAIARAGKVDLRVVYLHSRTPDRQWRVPVIQHPHLILDGEAERLAKARAWVREADLAVMAYYQNAFAAALLAERVATGRAWCFWGERPGVTRWAALGALYRRWKLRALHRSRAAIWGIGEFALERYRREFGPNRVYCNVPYFSDLSRFASARQPLTGLTAPLSPSDGGRAGVMGEPPRTVLYSGSLIPRKGVDLLAAAFALVAPAHPNLRLLVMGEGELRPVMEAALANVRDRVEFVGFQDWERLPEFYARAEVLCAPSRHDGWALVVPEALAAGLPVIGTDRMGAVRDLIQPAVNGWRIPAGQRRPLVEAIEAVAVLQEAALVQMRARARETALGHSLESGVARFQTAVEVSLAGWGTSGLAGQLASI
jgi:glycosyltransferase involved in cell wall biosynthesis